MQVIGLCRFSYPALGGFQVEHDSIEERRSYLYASDRLEERFRTFETMTLPCLQAQTDPEFTFVILIDDEFPEAATERLLGLIEDMPQAIVVARPPEKHRVVCKDVLNAARKNPSKPCIQFRMDDDDAVAVDFVERLRIDSNAVKGLCRTNQLVALDYRNGFIMQPDARGLLTEPCELIYYPMGMGMIVSGDCQLSIMNFAHNKVARFMPTVTFSDSEMFVRGQNRFNDSGNNPNDRKINLPVADKTIEDLFLRRFNIDADHIRRVFAK